MSHVRWRLTFTTRCRSGNVVWDTSLLTPEYTIEVKKGSLGLNYSVTHGTSPLLSGRHCGLHPWFSLCPSAGSSQPLAGFYSTLVLISLRWHGGEADLIIVMVAGGSHWLQTSATASHIRVLRRMGYSSCLTTGLPRALVLFTPTRQHLHRDFFQTKTIWDASSLGNSGARSVQAAKLFLKGQHGETASGLLLLLQLLALRGTACVYMTGECLLTLRPSPYCCCFFPDELLLAAWQRLYCWIQLGAGSALTRAGCYLCFRERFVWKQSRGGKKRRSLASPSP